MVIINNKWCGNILITNATDFVKTPPETVVKLHTKKEYGKMLGIDYTKFQVDGDWIQCTFQQRFSFKKFDMNFVKRITRLDDRVDIKFKTVNSMVDLRGKWSVTPTPIGSNIKLVQRTIVPGWALYVPGVEQLITGKVRNIFKQMKDI
jgi:hypothetical protein